MQDRHLDSQIQAHFQKYREILMLLGPRQTGKTTLLKRIFPDAEYLLVEKEPVRKILETFDTETYKTVFKPEGIVVLDEIQLVSNPGRAAKLIYDALPQVKLVITGSSSLEIKNKTAESMAGRRIEYNLFPLTFSEYLFQKEIQTELNFNIFNNLIKPDSNSKKHLFDVKNILKNILIYGLYPEMANKPQDKKYLENLASSLIFKDIVELNLLGGEKTTAINLLKLLAHQIGNLINYSELADKLQVDVRRVRRYIEIFEESFLIFRLYPFSKGGRNEIGKAPKIYFYDTGLRNTLIENFSDFDFRPDSGAIFENFIIVEILKANSYLASGYHLNFWRTKQGAEIDLVLTNGNEIIGAEIKLGNGKPTSAFTTRYPQAKTKIINLENFY